MSDEASKQPLVVRTTCCIAGGGPAGVMLGFLLARAGVAVTVLEKHADFLRDFRGDTVHPSTLELMHELGVLDDFLARPHQEIRRLGAQIGATHVDLVDFTHLPTQCKFIALMPQWDFLNFLTEKASAYPAFNLRMQTAATDLIEEEDRIAGVRAQGPDGPLEIRADLVVGADGRHSTIRQHAGLRVKDIGAPMDVLWLRLSRHPDDPDQALGYVGAGRMLILIDRGSYWQCGYVIRKGGFDDLRRAGLPAFHAALVELVPALKDRVGEIRDWNDVSLLTVTVDRLRTWYRPGLLCIGDAAHAMSPVGGVGINLAVQDAVAAANLLAAPLREGAMTPWHLQQVQERREFPTRFTQRIQVFIQKNVIGSVLGGRAQPKVPWAMRLLQRYPRLRRIPARIVGLGVRPEHVGTPDLAKSAKSQG